MSRTTRSLAVLIVCAAASGAHAVDGVIEINQARAAAGGVTPGDAPGFPVTIDRAGSYRLTGNLDVPASTTAVKIEARNITIDLGGFEIKGPNTCSGVPVASCSFTSGAPGISAMVSEPFVLVRNGRIFGMAGSCIKLSGDSSIVEDVSVFYCGNSGIEVGDYGRVLRSASLVNYGHGIFFGNGGAAHDNESRANQLNGIRGGGIYGGSITGNRVFDNGTNAIYGLPDPPDPARTLASKNVLTGGARFVSLGDNLCSGILC